MFEGHPLHIITPIKTRWGAYLDSIMRVLELWDRVMAYVDDVEDVQPERVDDRDHL